MARQYNPLAERRWKELGKWIEDHRTRRKFDRLTFARRAGIAVMTLQTIEAGGRNVYGEWTLPNPRHSVLAKLSEAMGEPYELLASLVTQASEGQPLQFEIPPDVRSYIVTADEARANRVAAVANADRSADIEPPLPPELRIAAKAERLTPEQRKAVESMIDELLEE